MRELLENIYDVADNWVRGTPERDYAACKKVIEKCYISYSDDTLTTKSGKKIKFGAGAWGDKITISGKSHCLGLLENANSYSAGLGENPKLSEFLLHLPAFVDHYK